MAFIGTIFPGSFLEKTAVLKNLTAQKVPYGSFPIKYELETAQTSPPFQHLEGRSLAHHTQIRYFAISLLLGTDMHLFSMDLTQEPSPGLSGDVGFSDAPLVIQN